jgi:hypothetical protein
MIYGFGGDKIDTEWGKENGKLVPCLITHYDTKTYGGVEV